MKVKATEMYKKLNIQDEQLKRIPEAGEEFEVSEERFEVLSGMNKYGETFVEFVERVGKNGKKLAEAAKAINEVETAKKEVKTEKAVKKTTKKAK